VNVYRVRAALQLSPLSAAAPLTTYVTGADFAEAEGKGLAAIRDHIRRQWRGRPPSESPIIRSIALVGPAAMFRKLMKEET
jgi:hypothetical protein